MSIYLMRRTPVPKVAYVPRQVAANSAIAFATGQYDRGSELLRLAEREMIDAQGGDQIVAAAHTAVLYAREIENLARPATTSSTDSQPVDLQIAPYLYSLGAGLLTNVVSDPSRIEPSDVFDRAGKLFEANDNFAAAEKCYVAEASYLRGAGRHLQAHAAFMKSARMAERHSAIPKYSMRYWAASTALTLKDRPLFAEALDSISIGLIDDPHYFVMFVFLESEMIRIVDTDWVRAAQYVDDHLPARWNSPATVRHQTTCQAQHLMNVQRFPTSVVYSPIDCRWPPQPNPAESQTPSPLRDCMPGEYGTGISTIFTPKAEVTSGTWNYFSKT
ncbi:hypothetical protein GCM10020255_019230 [Rhodococcus baikonurensis]